MIEIKKEVNSKIDWHSCHSPEGGIREPMHSETETIEQARKHYFDMLRRFLTELDAIKDGDGSDDEHTTKSIQAVFKKYNVHFVDVDDIKRVNIDEPKQ